MTPDLTHPDLEKKDAELRALAKGGDMEITEADIDRITLAVYRARLDATCAGDADRQRERDAREKGDTEGRMQANRSKAYRPVVVETLVQAGLYTRPVRVSPKRSVSIAAAEGGR